MENNLQNMTNFGDINLKLIVEKVCYIGLFIAAVFFVKNAWINYQTDATSRTFHTEKLKDGINPTLTICFDPLAKQSLLKNQSVKLSQFKSWEAPDNLDIPWISFYRNASYLFGIDYKLKINLTSYSSSEEELEFIFDDLEQLGKTDNGYFQFEEIYTLWSGLCLRIIPLHKIHGETEVHLTFLKSLELNVHSVKIYLTSEDNSNGIIDSFWNSGNMFGLSIRPADQLFHTVSLELVKYEKLPKTSKCVQLDFYHWLKIR